MVLTCVLLLAGAGVVAARNPSLPPPQPPSPPQPPATPGTQVTSSGVRRFPPRADIRPYSTTASGGIPFCEWYPSSGCVNNPQALRIDSYQNLLTNRRSETPATCGLSDTCLRMVHGNHCTVLWLGLVRLVRRKYKVSRR
jgi:hypothetical protein